MLALATFLLSFLLSYVGTVLLLRVRLNRRFVDVPNARSSHEAPKPRFGGIAIMATFIIVFCFLLFTGLDATDFLPLLFGGLVVFAAGVLDDWRSLSVSWRFLAQGAAIVIVVGTGNVVDHIYLPLVGTLELGPAGLPFTALFILASINFYNFIDGIDGLAAGSAFIVAGFLAVIALTLGHGALALVCLAMAGSAVGFLQFNFPPSRLFMGDSGSTFLGFFFAYIAIAGNRLAPEIPFFIPILILSSLYLDAGLTLVRRALRGERIFEPHHTHYYQRLLSLGLNHKQVTVLEYGLTILLGISAVIFISAGGFFPFFITLCWVAIFTALILKIRGLERGDRALWERRSLLVIGGDLLMIAVAYFGAYFLRMNFKFTDPEGAAVLRAFPFVLVVRSACFYWYGLYRGVWKYTSTPDVLRIIKAVATGSAIILALLVLFYRFVAFPRSLFVIEFFLLIIALGGSRFASRLFHEFGKEALGSTTRRVAIVGAGDYGERVGREIRNADGKTASVVCYIDDDKDKMGLVLQGVPIVGPIDRLDSICKQYGVDSLVLGISKVSAEKLGLIVHKARDAGVRVEKREGRYIERSHAGVVELDRISRELGRELPFKPMDSVSSYYHGKHVLLTNGGEELGPSIARELIRLGAHVTIHIGSQREAWRFRDVVGERCRIFAGGLEREIDLTRVLDAVRPHVVLHCASLQANGVLNREDYLWRKLVRATSSLCRVLPKYAIDSLAVLHFWGQTPANSYSALLGVASEVLLLNSSQLMPLAPTVIRLSGILTSHGLTEILHKTRHAESNTLTYSLLELEALAICLDAIPSYNGRVILVPRDEPSFSALDIRGVFTGGQSFVRRVCDRADDGGSLVYPTEQTKASIVPGAREVISPIYPASDDLVDISTDFMRSVPTDLAVDRLRSALCEGLGRSVGFSIE
ncbi:MAG: hypothetical protein OEN01_12345 [Candidatus Krumholzibacteria bacterium]|nr:hypothetical protein [Candidatus Krumholzibacteria bacterium]